MTYDAFKEYNSFKKFIDKQNQSKEKTGNGGAEEKRLI
jgi:uncharacterized protein (UPF0371 family)